ncbi:hypothetical protein G7054_g11294 [Neopestalotiopsis clavispora]|nr:hypothetical protein G7054_g11294 [Neopestalotiopsis clavispora]
MESDLPSPRSRRPKTDDSERRGHGGRSNGSSRNDYGRDKRRERSDSRDRERRRDRRSRSPRSPDSRRRTSRSRERHHRRDGDRRTERARENKSRHRRSPGGDDRNEGRSERSDRDRDRDRNRRHRRREDEDDGETKQVMRRSGPLPSQDASFAIEKGEEPPQEKEKPNFGNSGALAAASNSIAQADGSTIVLKYHEPPEARKPSPKDQWKLFVFKGKDIIDTIELNARTCWLIGREMAVIDIAAEHPSISKQHAVIQFRYLEKRNEYGDKIGKVKPYLIDLESANGTMLNSKKIPDSRYLELKDKDLIQLGQSTREYVIMLAPN